MPDEITGPQGCRNVGNKIFDMFIFFAFFVISRGSKAAAKHARLLQDCCNARKMFVFYESRKTTKRSPCKDLALYCKVAARMLQNARLPMKIAQWPHGCTAGTVRRLFVL